MPLIQSALSGLVWGTVGSLLFWRHSGLIKPAYLLAAPFGTFVGILTYFFFRSFYRKSFKWMFPIAVISTYIAVFLFGLVLGVVDLVSNLNPNRISSAVDLQAAIACLWSITFFPLYWIFFVFSFFNHCLIRESELQNA